MNSWLTRSTVALRIGLLGVLLLGIGITPAWAGCPELLMLGGVLPRTQTTPAQARYWGKTVGLDGFLLNYVMADWQDDVGASPNPVWVRARNFQALYSSYGAGSNFVKVAFFSQHDWRQPAQNEKIVENFAHAAALARYAGFKGVALDLEPYVATWGGSAGGPGLSSTVQEVGAQIGQAMHDAYPGMTLVLLPDVLLEIGYEKAQPGWAAAHHGGYGLALPFVQGLLSVPWSHAVVATEQTYNSHSPAFAPIVQQASGNYTQMIGTNAAKWMDFNIAPGLWPLGHSVTDKSARFSPGEFEQRLQAAFAAAKRYVWIFGDASAWQTDGPYGPGPVVANFPQYLAAIRQARVSCTPHS